jgi:hypothetical protein
MEAHVPPCEKPEGAAGIPACPVATPQGAAGIPACPFARDSLEIARELEESQRASVPTSPLPASEVTFNSANGAHYPSLGHRPRMVSCPSHYKHLHNTSLLLSFVYDFRRTG